MGTLLKYIFYIILIIVIYLVGRGIYEGQINETTTVGEVVSDVGQGTKEIVKKGVDATVNAAEDATDAGKNRRNLFKIKIGVFGNQTRNRGFSATRRPPENKRRYFSGLYHSAQRRVFSHDVVLPDDFGQSLRTQTVGKRPFNL